jgi:hypothetical protein
LGECLVFERNEVEHYKETVVLWSGAIKLISLYAFSNDKFVFAQYMIEAIRLYRREYT